MSDNKKYYYLKLKENFFDSEEMKILESMKNGEKYQNLYLKLCLLALKGNGKLIFKDTIPYEPDMLSVVLRVDIDTVKTGCELFGKLGLLLINDIGHLYMSDIQSLVGHGSTEAERKKEYRAKISKSEDKKELGHCPDKRPPEIEIEKDIELKKDIKKDKKYHVAEFVYLSRNDYKKLLESYPTKQDIRWAITRLDAYLDSNEKKRKEYKDHRAVLRKGNWVYKSWEDYKSKQSYKPSSQPKTRTFNMEA